MAEIIVVLIFFIAVVIAWNVYAHETYPPSYTEKLGDAAPKIIDAWAKENGYQVRAIEQKTRYVGRFPYKLTVGSYQSRVFGNTGPFIGTVSNGQHVYRVVLTKIGEEKRRVAWIRLGRGMWGNSPDDFQVIWEDEWRPQEPPVG